MNIDEKLVLTQSRADSYKLLSQCFLLPDHDLLSTLKSIQPPADSIWKELVDAASGLEHIDTLEVDYSRLFVGPFKLLAPPYESVYLDTGGQIGGDSAIILRNLYLDEGIDVSIRELPDHVAIELEFMYFLINKEISAINDGADDRLKNSRYKQRFFLNEYLHAWIPEFCKNVLGNSQTDFYKALAKVSETFVLNDMPFSEKEMEPCIMS